MKRFLACVAVLALVGALPAAGAKSRPQRVNRVAPATAGAESRPQQANRGAAPGAESAGAPGFPQVVFLATFEGQPTDSLAAFAFATGFRGAFLDDYFLTEVAPSDTSRRMSPALTNHFRLVRGDAFGDEWQLQVTIMDWWGVGAGVPPPADTTGARVREPGLRVNVAVLSAAAAAAGARPMPVREDLTFDLPVEPAGDYFAHAGRMVALLGLESLHHRSGDLGPDTRLRLDRTVRVPVITPEAPAPTR